MDPLPPQVQVVYTPQPARTSGMAVTSLVLGILSIMGGAIIFLPPIFGVIFGHLALGQCRRDPGLGGRGMAIAGLVLGYLTLAIWLLWILFFGGLVALGLFGAAAAQAHAHAATY